MTHHKEQHAENAEQKECIEDLRRFCFRSLAYNSVGLVPVIKRKQWLDDTGNPEEVHESDDKHEHLELADFWAGKLFCENYADYQEDKRFHQLIKL